MIYIYGDGEVAMTTGIGRVPGVGAQAPFIAFAPTAKIMQTVEAQKGIEDQQASVATIIDEFHQNGTVVFLNSPEAMRNMIFWLARIMSQLMQSEDWIEQDEGETVH